MALDLDALTSERFPVSARPRAQVRLIIVRDCDCDWPDAYRSHECGWHLEHVERVDGLVECTRVRYYDGVCRRCLEDPTPVTKWDRECAYLERGYVAWARSDWEAIRFDMVERDLDHLDLPRVERIVLTGRLWSSRDYFGEHDAGFDVEGVEAVVYDKALQEVGRVEAQG